MHRSCRLFPFLLASAAFRIDAADTPNVLFIVADDLNCRIGCYGDPIAKTPNIDRLAQRGVRFDRAYCNFPLCNPSRSSVLSGRYPTTTGVLDNKTWLVRTDGHPTLPRLFESQGYAVSLFGKIWHIPDNNGEVDPARPPAVQAWFTPAQRAQQQVTQPDFWRNPANFDHHRFDPLPPPVRDGLASGMNLFGPVPPGTKTADTRFADEGIARINAAAQDKRPFFIAVGFRKPHVALNAPQEYFDLYREEELPLPPDFANEPTGPAGLPAEDFRQNIDLYAARSFSAQEARAALRAYYACISFIDAQVGRLLAALDGAALSRNTIIILWGDHGWHLSEKGMWGKGTLFEVSARAPLIIVDPRQKDTAGRTSRRIVQFVDIYPTLADLAGLSAPSGLDGLSLRPLLAQPARDWDHPALTVQTRGWHVGRSLRNERWRYTEWDEGRRGSGLFDHDTDPHEMRNLAADPAHQQTVATLQTLLRGSKIGEAAR